MTRLLATLGVVLLLGGTAHSVGVLRLYLTAGVPDANRVLVDVWVAQAQLLAGGLYLAAYRSATRRGAWRGLAASAALTIIGFGAAMLPVLFSRAPILFQVPLVVYVVSSLVVVAAVIKCAAAEKRGTGAR